jgi:hypothetical protein
MSKLTRALVVGAMVAAMNLVGMTAIAQAQTTDEPASNQDARRPPTEGQVGESYRYYHNAPAAQAQRAEVDAVEQFRRGERASQERSDNSTPAQMPAPVRPAEPSR